MIPTPKTVVNNYAACLDKRANEKRPRLIRGRPWQVGIRDWDANETNMRNRIVKAFEDRDWINSLHICQLRVYVAIRDDGFSNVMPKYLDPKQTEGPCDFMEEDDAPKEGNYVMTTSQFDVRFEYSMSVHDYVMEKMSLDETAPLVYAYFRFTEKCYEPAVTTSGLRQSEDVDYIIIYPKIRWL